MKETRSRTRQERERNKANKGQLTNEKEMRRNKRMKEK